MGLGVIIFISQRLLLSLYLQVTYLIIFPCASVTSEAGVSHCKMQFAAIPHHRITTTHSPFEVLSLLSFHKLLELPLSHLAPCGSHSLQHFSTTKRTQNWNNEETKRPVAATAIWAKWVSVCVLWHTADCSCCHNVSSVELLCGCHRQKLVACLCCCQKSQKALATWFATSFAMLQDI